MSPLNTMSEDDTATRDDILATAQSICHLLKYDFLFCPVSLCSYFYHFFLFLACKKLSETCLSWTLNISKSCLNGTLKKVPMSEIFVNLTCINWTPVYSEHESWSQGGKVKNGFTYMSVGMIVVWINQCDQIFICIYLFVWKYQSMRWRI